MNTRTHARTHARTHRPIYASCYSFNLVTNTRVRTHAHIHTFSLYTSSQFPFISLYFFTIVFMLIDFFPSFTVFVKPKHSSFFFFFCLKKFDRQLTLQESVQPVGFHCETFLKEKIHRKLPELFDFSSFCQSLLFTNILQSFNMQGSSATTKKIKRGRPVK